MPYSIGKSDLVVLSNKEQKQNSISVKGGLINFSLFLLKENAILPMTPRADCALNNTLGHVLPPESMDASMPISHQVSVRQSQEAKTKNYSIFPIVHLKSKTIFTFQQWFTNGRVFHYCATDIWQSAAGTTLKSLDSANHSESLLDKLG